MRSVLLLLCFSSNNSRSLTWRFVKRALKVCKGISVDMRRVPFSHIFTRVQKQSKGNSR